MTHKRNIEGLRASAQRRHEEAVARAESAIVKLYNEGYPITFPNVAQTAGVSVAWLYQHLEIKQRIQFLRQQQSKQSVPPVSSQKDKVQASKDAVIIALKGRVKELTEENRQLKKQLEVVYGQLHQQRKPIPAT